MSSIVKFHSSETAQREFSQEMKNTLKNQLCRGISDEDFNIFIHACMRTGLDPFMRQIYAVPRSGRMTIQTGIDGYRLIADRTGKYAPGREPTFTYKDGKIESATSYVRKMTQDGTWHEVSATAFFSEYCPGETSFWKKMPHSQLSKCAEALAIRKAFPADCSGIYTDDEMAQASKHTAGVSEEKMSQICDLFVEFPDLKDRVLKSLGKNGKEATMEDIPDSYHVWIIKSANELRKQRIIDMKEESCQVTEEEICKEFV